MAGKDWNNLGRDLNRIIEDAVHMRNFGHLNDTINRTVRNAFQGFDIGSNDFHDGGDWEFNLSGQKPGGGYQQGTSSQTAWNAENKNSAQQSAQQDTGAYDYSYGNVQDNASGMSYGRRKANGKAAPSPYFAGAGKRKGGAIGMMAGGIILLCLSLLPLAFGVLVAAYGAGSGFLGVSGVFAAAGIFLTVKGSRGLKLSGRFDQYVRCLNGNTYGDIKMLADYTHKPEDFIRKDLKKMMSKGWFPQGHLDHKESCLIVSHEAYRQYMKALEGAKIQKAEARKVQQAEEKRSAGLSPEAKDIIDRGREYIMEIRRSNDAIPGEEVSEKIYKMELLVKRIFEQAEAHPENVPDLRKLMEYYLPMTMKLLKAYEELDQQPVQGDNIISSKKEIEDTLDTLNVAFAKLLDNLFQDRAWDVSSDISVLETMLAQEGLTEDGFPKK